MNEILNTDERADRIAGLINRIEHLNGVIAKRRAAPELDTLAIDEFTERRNKFVRELNTLLWSVGLTGELQMKQAA